MAPLRKKSIDDSQSGEHDNTTENKARRVIWSKNSLHVLCDLCIKHIEKSKGKNGGVVSQRLVWKKIELDFLEETKLPWDKMKLKNKLDTIKKSWSLWKQLKGKETGLGWDHVKGTISASSDWWALKIQENAKFEQFQDEGIEPELEYKMDQIFATSAQGNLKYTPGNIISEEDLHVDADDVYIPSLPTDIHHDMGAGEEENNDGVHGTTNASWDDLWCELSPTSSSPSTHIPQISQTGRDDIRKGKRALEGDSSQSSKSAKTNQKKKTGMAAFQEMFGGMMEVVLKRGESINEVTNLMKVGVYSLCFTPAHNSYATPRAPGRGKGYEYGER
ncbi:unnamed protein product, partial [Cuscuta epithymum]